MNDARKWLQAGDPLAIEPELSDAEAQRMRRTIVAAAAESSGIPAFRSMRWFVAAVAVLAVVIVGTQSARLTSNRKLRLADAERPLATEPPVTTPRQVQFVTKGGTRVIWQFNPEFDLEGSGR
jgi:hypothetical protein